MQTATVEQHQKILLELLLEFDRICRKHGIAYTLFAGTALGAVRHRGFIPWDDDADVVMLREDYDRFLDIAEKELGEQYFLQAEYSDHWPMGWSKLRKNNTTCLEKYFPRDPLTHQGIYIDIFPCDNASDNPLVRKLQFLSSRVLVAKSLYARGYETDSALKKVFMQCCRVLPAAPFRAAAQLRHSRGSELVHTFFGGTRTDKKSVFPRIWLEECADMLFEKHSFRVSVHYDALLSALYGDYMQLPKEEDRVCKVHALLVDTEKNYTEYEHYRDGMKFEVYTRSIR